jgi:hypothetical protein
MTEYRRTVTLFGDRVTVTTYGPLGKATCEGSRADWQNVRANAEFLAGHRAEP